MKKSELIHQININNQIFQSHYSALSDKEKFNTQLSIRERYIQHSNELEGDAVPTAQHENAYDYMLTLAKDQNLALTEDLILGLYRRLVGIEQSDEAVSYRNDPMYIPGTSHYAAKPEDIARLMSHYIGQMSTSKVMFDPFEFAIFSHKRIIDIQPFSKYNGQLARLLFNFLLQQHGYGIVTITADHKEAYLDAILRSQADIYPDIDPILNLGMESINESMLDNLRIVMTQ